MGSKISETPQKGAKSTVQNHPSNIENVEEAKDTAVVEDDAKPAASKQ